MKLGRYEKSEKSTVGTAVTFLMIGLGVGATIALLLAPKSGKQLRRDIRRGYDGARDTLQDWSEDAQERLKEAADVAFCWVSAAACVGTGGALAPGSGAVGSVLGCRAGFAGGILAAVCVVALGLSLPRNTSGASICT